jgi:hypothetical protein
MCMMSLSDLEPAAAAKVVLTHQFKDMVTDGKVDQLSNDLAADKMWEEYSDCHFHHKLFSCYALLREAFNGIFAEPTGVSIRLKITAQDNDALDLIDSASHANLVRILAQALSPDALLNRLHDEQLAAGEFPEATGILWQLNKDAQADLTQEYSFISSAFWFAALENTSSFEAELDLD